jgi:hypothetical protein
VTESLGMTESPGPRRGLLKLLPWGYRSRVLSPGPGPPGFTSELGFAATEVSSFTSESSQQHSKPRALTVTVTADPSRGLGVRGPRAGPALFKFRAT